MSSELMQAVLPGDALLTGYSAVLLGVTTVILLKCIKWFQERIQFVRRVNQLPGPSLFHKYPFVADLGPIFSAPSVPGRSDGVPDIANIFINITKEYKKYGLVRQWGFNPNICPWAMSFVMVWDEDLVKDILSQKGVFNKGHSTYKALEPFVGHSILTLDDGEQWKVHRKLCLMGQSVLDRATDIVCDLLTEHMFPYWDSIISKKDGAAIDIFEHMEHLTMDTLGHVLYHCDFQAMESLTKNKSSSSSRATLYDMVSFLEREIASRSRDPLRELWPTARNRRFMSYIKSLDDMLRNVANGRRQKLEQGESVPDDMLSKLVEAGVEESYILGNCKLFLYGGVNSTSATITWALCYLAANPEYQQRLLEEVTSIYKHSAKPSFADLMGCKFLQAIIQETLRLTAPTGITRCALKDTTIGGKNGSPRYQIPKDTHLFCFPLCANRLKSDDAHVFNPDRSIGTDNNSMSFHFSAGPRNCVGAHLAQAEARMALAHIIYHYQVAPSPTHEQPPRLMMVLNFNPSNAFVCLEKRRN